MHVRQLWSDVESLQANDEAVGVPIFLPRMVRLAVNNDGTSRSLAEYVLGRAIEHGEFLGNLGECRCFVASYAALKSTSPARRVLWTSVLVDPRAVAVLSPWRHTLGVAPVGAKPPWTGLHEILRGSDAGLHPRFPGSFEVDCSELYLRAAIAGDDAPSTSRAFAYFHKLVTSNTNSSRVLRLAADWFIAGDRSAARDLLDGLRPANLSTSQASNALAAAFHDADAVRADLVRAETDAINFGLQSKRYRRAYEKVRDKNREQQN